MVYTYKALESGTLSNPYRHIIKGEILVSVVEIKRAWLTPVIDGKPLKDIVELPVMSGMEHLLRPKRDEVRLNPPSIPDARLDAAIDSLNPKKPEGALTPIGLIVEAIGKLNKEDKAHFTKDGKPSANALTELVGFVVSSKQRDEAFELFTVNATVPTPAEPEVVKPEGTGNQDVL